MSIKRILLALSLVTPVLGACSTQMSATTTKGALDAFKVISMSRKDTCQTQKEIAEHNSRYETLKSGKETVLKAPCDVEQKVASK